MLACQQSVALSFGLEREECVAFVEFGVLGTAYKDDFLKVGERSEVVGDVFFGEVAGYGSEVYFVLAVLGHV